MNARNHLIGSIAALMLCQPIAAAAGSALETGNDPQLRRLFHPTEREQRREQGGQIFIYDGIETGTIDLAMEQQFSRIGNMMFIRTRVETGDGEEEVLEDGCD